MSTYPSTLKLESSGSDVRLLVHSGREGKVMGLQRKQRPWILPILLKGMRRRCSCWFRSYN